MKLSEIKGERTLDVIADLIEPVANIAEDDASAGLFKRDKVPDGVSQRKYAIKRLKTAVPKLIRGHKEDIMDILATLNGVTRDEYAGALSMVRLTGDLWELITDEDFIDLFISAQSAEPSGSALENTEAQEP